jgi:large subunit ribosomal protein L29
MKVTEIKELTTKELLERIDAEKDILKKMKLNHAVSPLDNPMKIVVVRKNIARLMTVLRQRQLKEKV